MATTTFNNTVRQKPTKLAAETPFMGVLMLTVDPTAASASTGQYLPANCYPLRVHSFGGATGGTNPTVDVGTSVDPDGFADELDADGVAHDDSGALTGVLLTVDTLVYAGVGAAAATGGTTTFAIEYVMADFGESKNYSINRAVIIEAALRKIGEFDQGETVLGSDISGADLALNLMVKGWVARGADLFLREEVTLFLQPGVQKYLLGTTAEAATDYVETTLTAAVSSTILPVTSSAGMTAADRVGVSGVWTTIVSVDSGTQITVTAPLTATSGSKVYAYTVRAGRPQKILYAHRRDTSDLDTEVDLIGEAEYRRISPKTSSGPPTQVWYNPTLGGGTLHVWPTNGGTSTQKLVLIAQTLPNDFNTGATEPQFPIEWGETLIWGLAAELGPEYGLPQREVARNFAIAEAKLNNMLDYDVENASVIFSMRRE